MEVVAREDKITHAIIGGGEQIHFGITDNAMFMHMLSSTLYSDKILAVCRETLCNSWDAHIDAGVTDKAIEITLTREKVTFKDFGFGIPRSKIGEVYGTYGNSTKKHDGNQTGGFGLGCKSPFAYVDHFEVTSCNEGTKTIYKMTKSSAELEGKPGIIPIMSVPTQETGITVSIDILSTVDYLRFEKLLHRLIANGEIYALINGVEIPVIEFSKMPNGYAITRQSLLENHSDLCIRYGNVIYPLERHQGYALQYDKTMSILSTLSGRDSHHNNDLRYSLVMQAPPHAVSITPSREALSMETKTIDTVCETLEKFLRNHFTKMGVECLTLVRKKVDAMVETKQTAALLKNPSMYNVMQDSVLTQKRSFLITNTADAARVVLAQKYPENFGFERKDMLYRLAQIMKAKDIRYDQALLRSFRSEYRRTTTKAGMRIADSRKWFVRNILAPLVSAMHGDDRMHKSRLMILGSAEMMRGWGQTVEVYPLDGFRPHDLLSYAQFMRGIVVLTHSKAGIPDRVRQYRETNEAGELVGFQTLHGDTGGTLAYIVPRTPKKIEQAREFFKQHARVLIDLTLKVEDRVREVTVRDKPAEKPKGYVKLGACWDKRWGRFDQENLTLTAEEFRVVKPEFVTLLNSRTAKCVSRRDLPEFNTKCTDIIRRLYGDRGCAVLSTPQIEKLNKSGVPVLEEFLLQEVRKLLKDKAIKSYVSMTPSRVKAEVDTGNNVDDAIDMIWSNDVLFKRFKLCAEVTQDQRDLLEVWDYLKRTRHWNAAVDTLKAEERSIPLNKKALALAKKIEASPMLKYLDLESIQEGIVSDDPEYAINLFIKACKG